MKCMKIVFNEAEPKSGKPSVLLGIIVNQDENFIWFRTANKLYQISTRYVIKIEETDQEYHSAGGLQ